ncbi:MAG: hypothetical protein DA408_13405 [Bacteroidetes bacterium]|nr:MAG: hypothetical protein C7N36_11500 [Bacteroidota bacterium]PTM11498.1 MAG: hypothetical protein DA408_13405 [Bacteroidota bacterium]
MRNAFFILFLGLLFTSHTGFTQQTFPYEWSNQTDLPLLGVGSLTTGVAIYLDRRVQPLTEAQIRLLDVGQVAGFDRYATRHYSPQAHQFSNITGLTSIAFPFALLLDQDNREHSGELLLITLEGALLNAGLINLTKTIARRTRPFVYNGSAPMALKLKQSARFSFYSGHTAVSSFFTFCGAQMYHDIYPGSRSRGAVWATAAVIPLLTGYGRVRAGRHFLSDVLVGYGVGALLGVVVPRLHRLAD